MPLVAVDAKTIPMVHTVDALSLISDSGIVRYQLEAKIWDIYSNSGDSYWYFPKGIHVERFDSLLHVEGSIVADTAYFFERKELWRAIGNVVVKNVDGNTFETYELFWNQKALPNDGNAFYTYQKVKITSPDGSFLIGANGFRSNQALNPPFLFSGKGELNVEESSDSIQQNTVRPDSMQMP